MIERTRGVTVDIDNVPLDDAKTYELLQRGDSIGVFQLEGGPMRVVDAVARPDLASMTSPHWSRCIGRVRWPPTCTTTTPIARTAVSRSQYLHPDARGGARRHLRLDDLPRERHAGRPEVRRLFARRRRQPAQGVRQEDPRDDPQGAREVRRWVRADRLRPRTWREVVRHHRALRRLRVFRRRTHTATGSSRIRRPISRRTIRSSTSPAYSPASRPTSTRRPSISTSAGSSGYPSACPT